VAPGATLEGEVGILQDAPEWWGYLDEALSALDRAEAALNQVGSVLCVHVCV
jgi:hypothetical protein